MLTIKVPTELDDVDLCKWDNQDLATFMAVFIPAFSETMGTPEAAVERWLLRLRQPEAASLLEQVMRVRADISIAVRECQEKLAVILAQLGPIVVENEPSK